MRLLKFIVPIILLVITSGCVSYYNNYNEVKSKFESINDIELLDLFVGNHDVTAEEISAHILIKSSKTEITFGSSLNIESFKDPQYLFIERYNDWGFITQTCYNDTIHGTIFEHGKIDVKLFGFQNIQNVINDHSEFERIIELIPEYPEFGKLNIGNSGVEFVSKIKREQQGETRISNIDCSYLNNKSKTIIIQS